MISCISLGLTALIIGLAIYTTTLFDQYVGHAYGIATHAEMNAKLNEASELLSKEVLRIYRSLTPKERAQTGTEAYRKFFSAIAFFAFCKNCIAASKSIIISFSGVAVLMLFA